MGATYHEMAVTRGAYRGRTWRTAIGNANVFNWQWKDPVRRTREREQNRGCQGPTSLSEASGTSSFTPQSSHIVVEAMADASLFKAVAVFMRSEPLQPDKHSYCFG